MASIRLAVALCAFASMATAQSLPESLKACAVEREDAARLACYDREVAALGIPPAAVPSPPPMARSKADEFGREEEVRRKAREREAQDPSRLQRLEAQVTAVSQRPLGDIIELDNGQVWEQTEKKTTVLLKPGEKITITPGALGSFFMTGESRRTIRVRRVR
jgi:hypothetical protein